MSQGDTFFTRTSPERTEGFVARNGPDPVLSRFGPYVPLPSVYYKLLPILTPSEVKVLLVILRQTLGWTDKETGSRKEREWITQGVIAKRTNLNRETIGNAVKGLVELQVVRVENEAGIALATPKERRRNQSRTYYRLNPPSKQLLEMEEP